MKEMEDKAGQAAEFMKGLASPHRLMLLCHMAEQEKSVTELMEATGIPQTSVSQHLGKLKKEGIVEYRRDHKVLYYRISHPVALSIMQILYEHFCDE